MNSDDILKIIHDDVKDIKKEMVDVHKTNATQNAHLGEHMRRTENLEKRMDKIDIIKWVLAAITAIGASYAKLKGMF